MSDDIDVREFTLRSEIAPALDQLLGEAHDTIRVFDPDLSECGYETRLREELLERFLRARHTNRLLIVLHDSTYLTTRCARMSTLLRKFTDTIEVRCTQPHVRNASDAFAIVDDTAYWRRIHRDHARAKLVHGDHATLHALVQRFEQLWEASDPLATGTVLGL